IQPYKFRPGLKGDDRVKKALPVWSKSIAPPSRPSLAARAGRVGGQTGKAGWALALLASLGFTGAYASAHAATDEAALRSCLAELRPQASRHGLSVEAFDRHTAQA